MVICSVGSNHYGKHMDGYFEIGYQDGEKIWRGKRVPRSLACSRYAPVKFGIVSYKVAAM